jgi:hypothetical protein
MALSEKKSRVLLLTLQGRSPDEIAAAARMSRRSVFRLRASPSFARELEAMRKEIVGRAKDKLTGVLTQAADELARLLGSQNEVVRLRACVTILDKHAEMVVSADLEERIARLEAASNHHRNRSVHDQFFGPSG